MSTRRQIDGKKLNVQSSYLDDENNFVVTMLLDRSKDEVSSPAQSTQQAGSGNNKPYQLEEIMLKYSTPSHLIAQNNGKYPSYIDTVLENTKRSNDLIRKERFEYKASVNTQQRRTHLSTANYLPLKSNQKINVDRTDGLAHSYQRPNKLVKLLERYYDWIAEIRKHRDMLERDLPSDMRRHVEKLYLIARDEIQSLWNVLSKFGVELDAIPYEPIDIDPVKQNIYFQHSKDNSTSRLTSYNNAYIDSVGRPTSRYDNHPRQNNNRYESYNKLYSNDTINPNRLYNGVMTSTKRPTPERCNDTMRYERINGYNQPSPEMAHYDTYSTSDFSNTNSTPSHTAPLSSFRDSSYFQTQDHQAKAIIDNKKKTLLGALRKQETYWFSVRNKRQKELSNKLFLNEEEKEILEQKCYQATQNLIAIKSNIRQLHGSKGTECVTSKLDDLLNNISLEPYPYSTEGTSLENNNNINSFPDNPERFLHDKNTTTKSRHIEVNHPKRESSKRHFTNNKSTMTSQDRSTMTEQINHNQQENSHENQNGHYETRSGSSYTYPNGLDTFNNKSTMFPVDSDIDSINGCYDNSVMTFKTKIITPTRSKIDFNTISCYYQDVLSSPEDNESRNRSDEESTPRLDALLERIGTVKINTINGKITPKTDSSSTPAESSQVYFINRSLNLGSSSSSIDSFSISEMSEVDNLVQKINQNNISIELPHDDSRPSVNECMNAEDSISDNNESEIDPFTNLGEEEDIKLQIALDEKDNHTIASNVDDASDEFKLDSYIARTIPQAPHLDILTKSKPLQNSCTFNQGSIDLSMPVVIDNGSGMIKAGMADEETPSVVMPNIVGKPNYKAVMSPGGKNSSYIGHQALRHKGVLKLEYPLHHGIVENWDDMAKVWNEVLYNELRIEPSEHPVLMTEAPLNPLKNRERMVEIMMENHQVPAFYVAIQATLALYGSGRVTGVVLDSGDGVTHIVPVYEGYSLPFATQRIDLGGHDITEYLMRIITERGYSLKTTSEREICREIKEELCFVAEDYSTMLAEADSNMSLQKTFMLPDGNTIVIGTERFRAPELLFQPSILGKDETGIHERLFKSVQKCDIDIRSTMYRNIILSGGTTLLSGIETRLQQELEQLLINTSDESVKICADPNRKTMVWRGGAAFALLPSFTNMCISNDEYFESGPQIVHQKCF